MRFVAGPAREEYLIPFLKFLKYPGFIGTGFAYQNIIPLPSNISKSGSSTLPKISICAIGLSVNLPRFFAVGSPLL